jgi:hypothetical protein
MSAQDEVALAKKLVAKVLGTTVPWPTKARFGRVASSIFTNALSDKEMVVEEGEEEEQQKWTLSVAYTTYPIISQ